MEIGKKYRFKDNPNYTYQCTAITTTGKAVMICLEGKLEFLEKNTNDYKEIKEPRTLKRYGAVLEYPDGVGGKRVTFGSDFYDTLEKVKAPGHYPNAIDIVEVNWTEKV